MRRYGKWLLIALAVAALVLTLTMCLGWTSSAVVRDISLFACNASPL